MARLRLSFLGAFQAWLDDQPLAGFESNKVRALLVYLAVEADRPHAREALAGLLWPDSPNAAALSNLRYALSDLRQVIGDRTAQPPFLLISRNTLQLNPASDHSLDVADFNHRYALSRRWPNGEEELHFEIQNLQAAIALYRGDFLSGFSIGDSAPFEEWALLEGEALSRKMMALLQRLADLHAGRGAWEKAQVYIRRQLEIEPWNEEAHRKLMLALALGGQRSAALAQYEACRQLLASELEVEPAGETAALYEAIRDGHLEVVAPAPFEELPAPGVPPYKGLQYFDEADAGIFFGREVLAARLANRLASEGFLAIVGASGSGKSSVLRAGLAPLLKGAALRKDDVIQTDLLAAQVRVFTPTAHPLQAFAAAMGAGSGWVESLRNSPQSFKEYFQAPGRFFLLVDQFEELFTLCEDDNERRLFIEILLRAAGILSASTDHPPTHGNISARVVVALRADYYAACAPYPELREALSRLQEYIGPMGVAELRRAIEEPASRAGWNLEAGLVDLLLHDLGAGDGEQPEPGALPLLSHALLETWKRRRGRKIAIAGYIEAGGVGGAIARTAEATYTRLTQQEQAVAQGIFLRLAVLGERAAHRRRARLSELGAIQGEGPELVRVKESVLKTLADARLITTALDSVEVAHEALIHEWPRLRGWLEESQEILRLQRRISDSALEWERSGQDPGILLRGARLAQSLEWAESHGESLSQSERAFLAASQELEAQESAEREALRQRELESAQRLAESERARAEEQARTALQLRRRALLLSGALGVVLLLAFFAFTGFRQAAQSARIAESETLRARADELAAEALNNLGVDPERSSWLALYALSSAHTPQAENALHQAVQASRALLTFDNGPENELWAVTYSPDGKHLVVSDLSGNIKILDSTTGKVLHETKAHDQMVEDVAFSPDGKLLATASDDSTVKLWEFSDILASSESTLQPLQTLSASERFWLALAFSPDGKRLAASDDQGTVSIWDLPIATVSTSAPLTLTVSQGFVWGIAFSPDGSRLATTSDDQIARIWDISQNSRSDASKDRLILTLEGHTNGLSSVAFSPDGLRLATTSYDSTARTWDAATGKSLLALYGHATGIRDLVFSPDGQTLFTAGQDGFVKAWDTVSGRERYTLAGHASAANFVAVSPDGQRLVTTGRDGTARVWDISSSAGREVLKVPGFQGIYSPVGKRLAVYRFMDEARSVQVQDWNVPSSAAAILLEAKLLNHRSPVIAGTSKPGGMSQASIDEDLEAYIWSPDGRLQNSFSLAGHMKSVYAVDLSMDGQILAVGSNDEPVITLWDTRTGQLTRTLSWKQGEPWGVAFSPDGNRLGSASVNSTTLIWDLSSGKELITLQGHQSVVTSVVYDREGKRLATTSFDSTARVWDAATGAELFTLSGHTATVNDAAFSWDGTRLATGSNDGTARVWDLQTGKELLTLTGNGSGVLDVSFSPDGAQLAVGAGDTVRVYLLRIEDLITLARSRLTRPLSITECQKYLHQETCPPTP